MSNTPNIADDLTTEVADVLYGKSIDGHPLFKINLRKAIEEELGLERAAITLEQYSQLVFASYNENSDVFIIIEPLKDDPGNYEAYMTTFPSEEQFQKLQKLNPELRKYIDLASYREHIEDTFFLPSYDIGAYIPMDERKGKYEKRNLFVPFSQKQLTQNGIKTPFGHMMDQMIEKLSA